MNDTVENIYDNLPDGDDGQGEEPGGLGSDVIYTDGNGNQLTPDEVREVEGNIKIDIAEAAQAAKMRGALKGKLAEIVADLLEVKTPCTRFLRSTALPVSTKGCHGVVRTSDSPTCICPVPTSCRRWVNLLCKSTCLDQSARPS